MSVPFSLRLCLILFPKSNFLSVQFSSVQSLSHVRLFAIPWTASSPGFPIHHQLLELTQTHVHGVGDAIQPSHPLLSPSPPAFNLSQYQGLFQWVSSLHQVAKVLEHLSWFQIPPRHGPIIQLWHLKRSSKIPLGRRMLGEGLDLVRHTRVNSWTCPTQRCDLGQDTEPLWGLVSHLVKWHKNCALLGLPWWSTA